MKHLFQMLILATLTVLPVACQGQGTFRITFDGPPLQPSGSSYTVQYYFEAGWSFQPLPGTDGFGRVWSNPPPARPDNGTPYLHAALGDTLMFTRGGALFGVAAVDLAEYSTVVPDARTVPFIGYRPNGSTVTTNFTTDGIIDGTGPIADFQTFYFGPEFSGLTRVEIPAYGWSLDNLYFYIPEPSAGALLSIGGLMVWAARTRRKTAQTSSVQ